MTRDTEKMGAGPPLWAGEETWMHADWAVGKRSVARRTAEMHMLQGWPFQKLFWIRWTSHGGHGDGHNGPRFPGELAATDLPDEDGIGGGAEKGAVHGDGPSYVLKIRKKSCAKHITQKSQNIVIINT